MGTHLRILSINGGGVKGIIPATILQYLSNSTTKQIPELFDFIIGTSIGGILASAYAAPNKFNASSRADVLYNASEVLNILKDNAAYIFPPDQAKSPTAMLFQEKYSRENIDSLLQEKFSLNGTAIKLIDTLVPIALTAQNAASNEPQLWFSCSQTFSTYDLKDAAGSTSAAPIYIPPKYIDVQNQTQANAQNCSEYNLVRNSTGQCQYKQLDGGLFANSPTLLAIYLLGQSMLGKTVDACTEYNFFGNSSLINGSMDLKLQFASMNPNMPPRIKLGEDIDITVVSVGTGYFIDQATSDFSLNDAVGNKITGSIGALSTYIGLGGLYILGTLAWPVYMYYKAGDGGMGFKGHYANSINCDKILGMVVAGIGVAFAAGGLWGALFAKDLVNDIDSANDGVIGFAKHTLMGILSANEAADVTISRDTFGAITIDPIFYNITPIPLDASDDASLKLMEDTTNNFIDQNLQAFVNLTICLKDTTQRLPECDYAAMYFYDNFRDSATHGIITQSLVPELQALIDSTIS